MHCTSIAFRYVMRSDQSHCGGGISASSFVHLATEFGILATVTRLAFLMIKIEIASLVPRPD